MLLFHVTTHFLLSLCFLLQCPPVFLRLLHLLFLLILLLLRQRRGGLGPSSDVIKRNAARLWLCGPGDDGRNGRQVVLEALPPQVHGTRTT